ncbi:MAG: hypothetical protein IJG13_07380 [Kiritimatiellae bacterium]|nr:hypothetical protein [Kiritimatiellia bacterium]
MSKLFVTLGAVAVAAACQAGIKYWDNPAYKAFDVGDYVPGAVWHYDGIDNAGTGTHDPTATTWVNLGSSGANNDVWVRYQKSGGGWANSSAPSSLDPVGGKNLGSWTANGFTFTGDSEWRSGGSIDTGTNYTIQALVTAKASSQTYGTTYLMSVQKDHFAFTVNKSEGKLYWKTQNSTTSNHPFISGDDFGYMTAILNATDNTATFFSGTEIPTSGDDGFRQFSSVSGKSDNGYCICGYTGNDGQFVGTIHFYRYYKKVLTEEELAWNRVVDERRFFGRTAPLPVTNVEVATSVAGATGAESAGCYAVDGRHTFVAPATVNVGGIDYVCTGYTVETRSGDGWSDPVFHKAALYQPVACVVTEGECVRLTWQWAKAAGLKNLGYTVHDYVWDGLEVFYDGICNQGTNVAHSTTATNWVNLGSKGDINDMFVQRLNAAGSAWDAATDLNPVGGRDPGCWTEHGFALKGASRFRCNAPGDFNVGTSYSLQMLVDAKVSDQGSDELFYLLGANNDTFAFRIKSEDGNLYWRYKNNNSNMPYLSGGIYDYITAIMRADNKQTFFSGTTEPTSGNGYKTNTSYGYSDTGFCLGGYGKNDRVYLLVGTIKSFRQYDHALDPADVAKNRAVDNWRYFGIPDNPNVVVQSTVPYLRGDEPDGPYAVDGSHVFAAPATMTAKGITYACDGYIVEEWDGSSTWTNATSQTGNSYTYTVGTSPALVRLTWKWKATRGLRTAADYSFDDYSQAGLLWNYDGIRNQGGTDADHDSSATTWKNLGSAGSDYDLAFRSGETTTGEWAADGYIFRGGPRFRGGGKVGPLKNFTLQTLIDADIARQTASSSQFSYIMNAYDNHFNISLVSPSYDGSAASSFCWKAQGGMFMYFHAKDNKYSFATAMMDYDNKKAMMFPDTAIPTEYHKDGTYGAQRLYNEFASVTSVNTTGYGLGNRNNNGTEGLVGTLKNFRYYDRVLTEEELVRNRNVDAVRYFGVLGVTNVFVVAGGGTQAEEGAYKVEGSWEFSATTVLDENNVPAPVIGYYTQGFVDGRWTPQKWHDGSTYSYIEGTSPAMVRLIWRSVPPPGMSILIR